MAREKITSLDVALRAGVSRSAVSRVFTPGASASEATRTRVLRAAEDLGYRPNTLARAVITGKSRIIGLVVGYLDNQFYPLALEQLSRDLQARGYQCLLFLVKNAEEEVAPLMQHLFDYQVDGIITASVGLTNDLTERCRAAGIPVVMFNRGQAETGLAAITSDNEAGGRMVANFLASGGHERIAHISGWLGASTGRDRQKGFLDGLAARGTEPLAVEDGMYNRDVASDLARTMFSRPDRPDAVFVGNDHMALAVMDVLRFELGLRVPDDVSVVGYDDVPIADWPTYALTTVRQPVMRMIAATAAAIVAQIEEGALPQTLCLPAALVIRSSARKPQGFAP